MHCWTCSGSYQVYSFPPFAHLLRNLCTILGTVLHGGKIPTDLYNWKMWNGASKIRTFRNSFLQSTLFLEPGQSIMRARLTLAFWLFLNLLCTVIIISMMLITKSILFKLKYGKNQSRWYAYEVQQFTHKGKLVKFIWST